MKKNFKKGILTVFLVVFTITLYAQEKLIFVTTLIRHGDRTPTHELKVDPYNWEGGIGELTPHGMNQEFKLGSQMRKRYVDDFNLLPEKYVNNLIYVRSTDFNRTIMSAESFLYGLYPLGSGPELSDKTPALPKLFQPIPIRTLPQKQDYLLLAKDNYVEAFEKAALAYLKTDRRWIDKNNSLKGKFKVWEKQFGIKLNNLTDIIHVGDNLNVRIKNNIPLPKGITKSQSEEVITDALWAQAQRFKPKYISAVLAKVLLRNIEDNMTLAIENKNTYKYILYSGHDSTIMPIMSAIGAPLDSCPPYASHVDFELYNDDGSYFVKIFFNDKPVILPNNDNKSEILFSKFKEIAGECQDYTFK